MISSLSFGHLSHQDFEQLCYELLPRMGFINVKWRAPGTDGGRDIEAETFVTDPTGYAILQRWYVECKHYSGSVPREEIIPKWQAAFAAGIDHLFILTSAQLSNDCLDHLDKLQKLHGRPAIRYWTGLDLSLLILKHADLIVRFFPSIDVAESSRQANHNQEIASAAQQLLLRISNSFGQRISGQAEPTESLVGDAMAVHAYLLAISAMLSHPGVENDRHSEQSIDLIRLIIECSRTSIGSNPIEQRLPAESIYIRGKRPYLQVALLEVLANARLYGRPSTATVAIRTENQEAYVIVDNETAVEVDFIPDFPRLGFRSGSAVDRFPGGVGVGCWLVEFLMRKLSSVTTWKVDKTKWQVTLGPFICCKGV